MCDEHTEKDNEALFESGRLTRRRLGVVVSAAGLAAWSAACATTASNEVVGADVMVPTPDGEADAYFVHPSRGAHAAVLIWPDILGLRPAFRAMGDRLAGAGYSVLVVNPFYRRARAPVVPEGASFADESVRNTVFPLAQSLTPEITATDATAFVAWLDAQDAVDTGRKIGTTGYCMGGPLVVRTAAARSDRIGAVGSFHGGGLTTDQPNSPHLLIPQTNASYLIAIAQNDDANQPASKDILREAFDAAGRMAEVEVYPAQHGWCPPDSQVYDEAQAERAWARMLALFETALA
jgi:carboxymethylenebutenolidase